eukprot:gene10299-7201_t
MYFCLSKSCSKDRESSFLMSLHTSGPFFVVVVGNQLIVGGGETSLKLTERNMRRRPAKERGVEENVDRIMCAHVCEASFFFFCLEISPPRCGPLVFGFVSVYGMYDLNLNGSSVILLTDE